MFPQEVQDAANRMSGEWITASEFEEGLVLQVSKALEKIKSTNPKYGAQPTDYLVKKEILEVGETFRYFFKTPEGMDRKIDSKSSPMFIGFKQCEELGVGDWIKVTRTGERDETRFTVEKIDTPKVNPAKKEKTMTDIRNKADEDAPAGDIPF